jgi:hypothetical protein
MTIVAIILFIPSGGTSMGLMAVTFEAVVLFVAKAIVVYGIGLIVGMIAKAIGGVLGVVIGVVVGMIMMYYGVGMEYFSSDMWLQLANTTIKTTSQMLEHEMAALMVDSAEYMEMMAAKMSNLEELAKEYSEDIFTMGTFDSAYAGTPNPTFQSIQQYCDELISANVETIVDYGAQMDYAIATRTNVISGVG